MGNSITRRNAAIQRRRLIHAKSRSLELDPTEPRFVADVMLGRLAKWLRIAGFDVLYSNRFADDELVALSRDERRILLSRDTRLLIRKSIGQFIFLKSDRLRDQLRQVFDAVGIRALPGLMVRCLSCNEILEETPRDRVRDRVPPYVYQTHLHFKCCPGCRKVFWAGTHRQAVLRTLESVL